MDGSGPGEASLGEAGAGSQESAEAELTQAGSQESAKEAELTQTLEHLREELRKAKDDHNMATGAISSLQRQLEIQDSELRRIRSEKEMLQKQLKEQKDQLQAMSDKFCSLTEEQRKEEIMAMMEEKNHSLQQVVMEQESQLARQNELISELEGTISRLRIEVVTSRRHLREQEQAQKEIQSRAEALEHTELQTRVALERMSSKFERCRNKIIQVAFNMEGTHDRSAELTDEQVLQGMQEEFSLDGKAPLMAKPESTTNFRLWDLSSELVTYNKLNS
ncbi:coiled-coil domain containing 27 [Willisornis vidua]|uniref:Coiled-coil domain containing 27 n=1 Tax=Willisornis vidua TaxID=1566151 RepID=A0ABQ9DLI7_9PASS|nr:coiled-coil domain containing 27 [Willisornis vidua]